MILRLLLTIAITTLSAGEQADPPVPPGAPASTAVQVAVDGRPLAVYARDSLSYASFTVTGTHRVVVTATTPMAAATVRPLARKVAATVAGSAATLAIAAPGQYCVEVQDGPTVMLFADPPEAAPPRPGPDVISFAPGFHDLGEQEIAPASGQTVYLAAGAYVQPARLALRNVERVTVRGRGVLAAPTVVSGCRDILIEGLVIALPRKTWMNRLDANLGVTYRNTKSICLDQGVNNDGFDIMSGNHRIVIEDSFIRSNDDVIAFKHHPNSPGYWGSKTPTSGVDFRRNVLWNMNGGNVFEIGVETCGSSIGNLRFSDCDIIQASAKGSGVFDIGSPDHARIHDITYERIRVERYAGRLIDFALDHGRYRTGQTRGTASGIIFRDIEVLQEGSSSLIGIAGRQAFSGVHFENVRVLGKPVGSLAELNAKAKDVHDITFDAGRKPVVDGTAPGVISALGIAPLPDAPALISLAFDEQIDPDTAARPGAWTLTPAIPIHDIRIDPGLRHATLVLGRLAAGQRPQLAISAIADLAGNAMPATLRPALTWSTGWDAAADLPPLQGFAGWYAEQFNPDEVMTWSGRPDLMAKPTHWLISWLPGEGGPCWIGHDAALRLAGARMQVSERFQPVRCWRAPFAGTIRITGTVTPVQGPLRARLTRLAAPKTGTEGEPLWGWQVVDGAAVEHAVTCTVQRDDLIRGSIAAPADGRPGGQSAEWTPRISYLSIADP